MVTRVDVEKNIQKLQTYLGAAQTRAIQSLEVGDWSRLAESAVELASLTSQLAVLNQLRMAFVKDEAAVERAAAPEVKSGD